MQGRTRRLITRRKPPFSHELVESWHEPSSLNPVGENSPNLNGAKRQKATACFDYVFTPQNNHQLRAARVTAGYRHQPDIGVQLIDRFPVARPRVLHGRYCLWTSPYSNGLNPSKQRDRPLDGPSHNGGSTGAAEQTRQTLSCYPSQPDLVNRTLTGIPAGSTFWSKGNGGGRQDGGPLEAAQSRCRGAAGHLPRIRGRLGDLLDCRRGPLHGLHLQACLGSPSGGTKRSSTRAKAPLGVRTVPSNCASSTARRIRPKHGPGRKPAAMS